MNRSERRVYVVTILIGFAALLLLTRSPIVIGDAAHFMLQAKAGDPAFIHYGEPSHFLQVPLARAIWLGVNKVGISVSLASVFIGISLLGTLTAIICFGLVAAEILGASAAAWIGAVLFGTSLNIATQWNGELYGLGLGFLTAGVLCALRRRRVLAAFLWALAVLSRAEFVLAAPVFMTALWLSEPAAASVGRRVRSVLGAAALAGATCLVILLAAARMLGKWSDLASLNYWLHHSVDTRVPYLAEHAEIGRALKGLLTAFTVAGHFLRDLLTGRGLMSPAFVFAAVLGLAVIGATLVMLAASLRRRRALVLGLLWLLPFHICINWWLEPTVEKYHAGALPGFVLLVTTGVIVVAARLKAPNRVALYVAYCVACAGLNIFGAVLPMQKFGRDTVRASVEMQRLVDARQGRAVFVACDEPKVLVSAGIPYLRMRSVWVGSVPEIKAGLSAWVADQLRQGKEPYLFGRWCRPEEWKTKASKAPFDLLFLRDTFDTAPTGINGIPVADTVPTNPFSWTRGDVLRLEAR